MDINAAFAEFQSRHRPVLRRPTLREVVRAEMTRMRQSFEAVKQDPAYASSIPYCDAAIELLPKVEETYAYWLEEATLGDRVNQVVISGRSDPMDPEARNWLRDPMALQRRIKASQEKMRVELNTLEIPSHVDDAQAQKLYDTFATVEYAALAKKVTAFALQNLKAVEAELPREK